MVRPIRIGGGGFLTGFDQHTDGTLVCRTDTYGAYIWNTPTTDQWNQLVTTSSMPAADAVPGNQDGVYEICIAPSNSSVFWMCYNERVYKSTNKGTTWVRNSAWPSVYMSANGTGQRCYGPKMAVDPLNADIVYIGTQDDGIYRTLDGGANWSKRTDVPDPDGVAADNAPGITGVLFDPTSGATSGRTANVWCFSEGNGYYRSTDGGTTWSKPTGGPTNTVPRATFSIDGNIYCSEHITSTGKAWKWNGTSWSELTTGYSSGRIVSISCDPFDADRVFFYGEGGGALETLDAGVTFGTQLNENPLNVGITRESSNDIPWFEMGYDVGFMSNSDIRFDKTGVQNKLLFSEGIGFWYATVAPGFTTVNWNAMARGIEQLATFNVTATPNGDVFLTSWDRPHFKLINPEAYPSTYIFETGHRFSHGKTTEYLMSNPDIVTKTSFTDSCGYSTNGGDTWTLFTSPAVWSIGTNGGGGEIVPLSSTSFIWVPTNAKQPHYTTNTGANWTGITLPNVLNDTSFEGWAGLNNAYYLIKRVCAADRVTAGTAYITHAAAGVFKTTDYGANWTQVKVGYITQFDGNNTKFRSVPGYAGHLWHTLGDASDTVAGAFKWSEDGGANWSTVTDVLEVKDFGFGATKPGASYPRIWIAGYVDDGGGYDFGIYYSDNKGVSWSRAVDGKPLKSLDGIKCIDGDKLNHERAYGAFDGSGFFYIDER